MIIFSRLPEDIIKYILSFDRHFVIRRGHIVSIIPKDDARYDVLRFTVRTLQYARHLHSTHDRYVYRLPNRFNSDPRRADQGVEDDMVEFTIGDIYDDVDVLECNVFLARLLPMVDLLNDSIVPQFYYKGTMDDYAWHYRSFTYRIA